MGQLREISEEKGTENKGPDTETLRNGRRDDLFGWAGRLSRDRASGEISGRRRLIGCGGDESRGSRLIGSGRDESRGSSGLHIGSSSSL